MKAATMALVVLGLLCAGCGPCPRRKGEAPKSGVELKSIILQWQLNEAEKQYLGLESTSGAFGLSDIRAKVLIIWLFDMYCPNCQKAAPRVNEVYRLVNSGRHSNDIKLIGVGAGNSSLEVASFKKKLAIPFPAFPDENLKMAEIMSKSVYPYFLVLRLEQGEKIEVVFGRKLSVFDPSGFLALVTKESGLK